ncbi:MAG: pimeloyl-ACP methyl ester carboxylesterase [Limisphaerales bacterium]|jgi:pimeloyl-ACP methyl ester carboxylesterase
MRSMNRVLVCLGAMFALTTLVPDAHAFVDDFAKNREVLGASISPTGEYLAVIKEEDGERVLATFSYPQMELLDVVNFKGKSEVGRVWWANNDRLLIRINIDFDRREEDSSYGELYAVNVDGTKGKYLYGFRADGMTDKRSRVQTVRRNLASASPEHMRWQDPRNVLVTFNQFNRGFKSGTSAALLDIYTGRLTQKVLAPTANADMVADNNGDIRFSFYLDDDQVTIIHYLNPETGDWEEFSRAEFGEVQIVPVAMHDDGRVYVSKSVNEGPEGLYLMDPKTQKTELVFQDDVVDFSDMLRDWQGRVYGVSADPDFPQFEFTDESHPSAQLTMGLMNVFKDGVPEVVATTHDYRLSIVAVTQDTRSPELFLYDSDTQQLKSLFDSFPWIDDDKLSPMEPIKVTARDGVELYGYLTVPKGHKAKDLPLVVVPHGGPHGPRDLWGFQWFEGFLPANGYAILQINFRGSGGYGQAFENMGYEEWDGKMMDDIVDATRWAIDEGIADPERLCVFGWSFGGYSAAMTIVREPDLFKCSVAGAGVYDNKIQFDSDFGEGTRWGRKYLAKVIGDREALDRASPKYHVDKIKTPLLLIHGDADARVPIEHAYEMQKAYRRAGKPEPRLIKLKNEAHTPRKEENKYLYQQATIDFIEKHIGPGLLPK